MRIVVYLHLICPEHNAGSETTIYAAMRAMARRGHSVSIICDRSAKAPYECATLLTGKLIALRKSDSALTSVVYPEPATLIPDELDEVTRWFARDIKGDGVNVLRQPRRRTQSWLQEFVADCDLLITHLDLTSLAMQLALTVHKPLVHFIHNDAQLEYWRVNELKAQLVVFNSHWIAESEKRWYWLKPDAEPIIWPGPSVTVHPVVEPRYYVCERGEGVTLVNPTSGKGAATFYELAQRMPDRQFITAQGGYGHQVACPSRTGVAHHTFYDETGSAQNCHGLPNVTHLRNDPDVRNVFRQTKVLLMPSDYESYGRVGVEAACAGIPTIAHPTAGLKEAFGDAAIFIDRNDVDAWADEIERLYGDEAYYQQRSEAALQLAASLQPEAEFDRLEQALVATATRWREQQEGVVMNIWISDRKIWKLKGGGYRVEEGGRIPQEAAFLFAGVGTKVQRDLAVEQGWIGQQSTILQVSAVEEPEENKMVAGPAENKAKRRVAA